jgi:hypothetical protein
VNRKQKAIEERFQKKAQKTSYKDKRRAAHLRNLEKINQYVLMYGEGTLNEYNSIFFGKGFVILNREKGAATFIDIYSEDYELIKEAVALFNNSPLMKALR